MRDATGDPIDRSPRTASAGGGGCRGACGGRVEGGGVAGADEAAGVDDVEGAKGSQGSRDDDADGAPPGLTPDRIDAGLESLLARAAAAIAADLGAARWDACVWAGDAGAARDVRSPCARIASSGRSEPRDVDAMARLASLAREGGHACVADSGRHLCAVPLGSAGWIEFERHDAPWTALDLAHARRLAATFVDPMLERLPREHLLAACRRSARLARIDREVAETLLAVEEFAQLGTAIDAIAGRFVAIELSAVYFHEPDEGRLRLLCARGLSAADRAEAERTAHARHPGAVVASGMVVDVLEAKEPTVTGRPGAEPAPGHDRQVRSRVYVPVSAGGRVVGTIGFASSRPHAFGLEHREVLASLGAFAGSAFLRLVARRELGRRTALLESSTAAIERVLGAIDWRPAAVPALGRLGATLGAGALALVELGGDLARARRGADEFAWQPTFGAPWGSAARVAREAYRRMDELVPERVLELAVESDSESAMRTSSDLRVEAQAGGGTDSRADSRAEPRPEPRPEPSSGIVRAPIELVPIVIESQAWGVLVHEPAAGRTRRLDRAERSALRALAQAFATAIGRARLGPPQGVCGHGAPRDDDFGRAAEGRDAGRTRVLYVDDDPIVLAVGRDMIESMGLAVEAFASAAEALAAIDAERGDARFDLVITDLAMPGMGGIEFARAVRTRDPSRPILCCTGFVDATNERLGRDAGIREFIRKPIDLGLFERSIRLALGSES